MTTSIDSKSLAFLKKNPGTLPGVCFCELPPYELVADLHPSQHALAVAIDDPMSPNVALTSVGIIVISIIVSIWGVVAAVRKDHAQTSGVATF